MQENHYYAFGMGFDGPWQINDAAKDNPYQYNGKELNLDHGLNWSDYGARWYDACVGRWTSVDPLVELTPSWNPYNYVQNTPINAIDPDGRSCLGCGRNGEDFLPPTSAEGIPLYIGSNANGFWPPKNGNAGDTHSDKDGNFVHDGKEWRDQNNGSVVLSEATIIASRTNYQATVDGVADKGDFFSGTTALVPGSFRLTNGSYNGSSFSPRYYSSGWTGGSRARISSYNIGKIGNAAGSAFLILGTVNDGIGVYNYYQNPSATNSNAVHPGKAGINLGIGVYGMYINPIPAVIYGGLEAFYPGGAAGAMEVQAKNIEANKAINPNYHPFLPKL